MTAFTLWVNTHCCCVVCGAPHPDAHHLSARKGGGRSIPELWDVENGLPLCRDHHNLCGDSIERMGIDTFANHHGFGSREKLFEEAAAVWHRYVKDTGFDIRPYREKMKQKIGIFRRPQGFIR